MMKTAAYAALAFLLPAGAAAHTGFGMAVDRQGRVVFLDAGRSTVWRIELNGQLTALATGKHADTLVQDAAGDLYVENFNQTLWKIAPDGGVTRVEIPARVAAAGKFGSLDEILAIDREGNFYVSSGNEFYRQSPQIFRITPRGEVTLLAGSAPGHADGKGDAARFSHVRSAAWGPDGALYVADGSSVRRVTLDGEVTTVLQPSPGSAEGGPTALENGPWLKNTTPTGFGRLNGIAVDQSRNIYVADSDNFRICKIDPRGGMTTVFTTHLPWKPTGVATSGEALYVMEQKFVPLPMIQSWFDTHRVHRIAAGGPAIRMATVGGGGGYIVSGLLAVFVCGVWSLRRWRKKRQTKSSFNASVGERTLG